MAVIAMRPILQFSLQSPVQSPDSVNHSAPSGPVVMP